MWSKSAFTNKLTSPAACFCCIFGSLGSFKPLRPEKLCLKSSLSHNPLLRHWQALEKCVEETENRVHVRGVGDEEHVQ
eukprot:182754-Rhodomonas_salina.1